MCLPDFSHGSWEFTVRSTPCRSKTNGIAERAVRRVKEGTSAILHGGPIPRNVAVFCAMCKTSPHTGKLQNERRFGEPFFGPVIPCVSMVEHQSISAMSRVRLHQFGKKGPSGHLHWICAEWREASGTEIFWVQTVRKCKTWTRQRQ